MEAHREENFANLRVASFSYYLEPSEENFVQKISGLHHIDDPLPGLLPQKLSSTTKSSIIKPSENLYIPKSFESQENILFRVKSPQIHYLDAAVHSSSHHAQRISSSSNNGEIEVFGADKYFNMPLEYKTTMKNEHESNQGPVDFSGLNFRPKTPSISSEASSWNGQAALLRNLSQEGTSEERPRRANRRRIFSSFSCGGQCLEKGEVSMEENLRKDARRLDLFSFPVLNNDSKSNDAVVTIKKLPIFLKDEHQKGLIEAPRKSLEVFGSGTMKNGDIAMNMARKLSMLTWDAVPKSANGSTTTLGSTTTCHDQDMTSDASSDLFEIEDISGAGCAILNSLGGENQDEIHGNGAASGNFMPSSPTHEYAPSEATIEFSVVRASAAADFSSVISDYDEKYVGISGDQMIHTNNSSYRNSKAKNLGGKKALKGRPGGLLGCKSRKAVNVVETVLPKSRIVERY